MKHDLRVTLMLITLFLTAQVIGLYLLNLSIYSIEVTDAGTIEVEYTEPLTGRPDLEGQSSFVYILAMILFGTLLVLGLIKFKLFKIWKAWFFLAVWGALAIALSVVIPDIAAIIVSLILTAWKIIKPNIFVHNITEVFMYAGIAIMISPLFTVYWAALLLIAISIYDAIAVWKLKHMITMATEQAKEKMFAGLMLPYTNEGKISISQKKIPKDLRGEEIKGERIKSAILGGGDIAFPMLFGGSVMTWLIEQGLSKNMAFFNSLVVAFFSGVTLLLLLIKSKKDKFYPAMPFITAGCFIGFLVVFLLN